MAAITVMELQDAQTICKVFERGCQFDITEESVYAVMAPQICSFRNVAKTTKKLINDGKIDSTPLEAAIQTSPNTGNLDSRKSLANQWKGDQLFGILNSDCIPCKFRLNFKLEMNMKSLLYDTANQLFGPMMQFLLNALEQIRAMMDMLSGKDKYVDLCHFVNFFKEFMCIPDIQTLIASLTALLMQLSIELTSMFDILLQLIGPLLLPFLQSVISQINQLLMLAIKPLECIIDAITNLISKIDINALFQNVGSMSFNVPTASAGFNSATQAALDSGMTKGQEVSNANKKALGIAFGGNTKGNTVQPFNGLKDVGKKLDYASAAKEGMQSGLTKVKSLMGQLIAFCREAIAKFQAIFDLLVGDFLRLLQSLTGGGSGMLFSLQKKLAIVQMIALLKSLLKMFREGNKCDEKNSALGVLPTLPFGGNTSIFTDSEGNVHVDQNTNDVDKALEEVVKNIGASVNDGTNAASTGDDARQKLQSLIKFTGDSILDSSISRTLEAVTAPMKLTFKCPLQTTVSDAEKVNKWIAELNEI